jgi:hypothetical protein
MTMRLPSHLNMNVSEERLDGARQKLREVGREISDHLNGLPSDGETYERALISNYGTMLKLVGHGLFRAASELYRGKDIAKNLDFYFWPGYTCLLRGRHYGARIALSDSGDCGIGYWNGGGPYTQSDAARWFNLLLGSARGGQDDFVPGGTHAWFGRGGRRLKLHAEDGGEPLENMIVSCSEQLAEWPERFHRGSTTNDVRVSGGTLTFMLDLRNPRRWGPAIASRLNDPTLVDVPADLRWPATISHDLDGRPVAATPEARAECREAIYSLWLLACFVPEWRRTHGQLALDILDGIRPLAPVRATQAGRALKDHPPPSGHYYKSWTTLHLDPAPGSVASEGKAAAIRAGGEELGTAMYLANANLPPDFLRLVRPWVQLQYLSLRYVERSREVDSLSARAALEMLAHVASNRIDIVTREVEQIPVGGAPSDLLRSQLLALRAEVGLFQGKEHNHELPALPDGERDPIGRYLSYAWEIAAARAQRNRLIRTYALQYHTDIEAVGGIVAYLDTLGGGDCALLDAGSRGVLGQTGRLMRTESFCMMFVRSLYPAFYHWIRQRQRAGESAVLPRIEVRLDEASHVIQVSVISPRDPWESVASAPAYEPATNDRTEIQLYARYFVGGEAKSHVVRDATTGDYHTYWEMPLNLGESE